MPLPRARRAAAGWPVARDVVFPALAVAGIVAAADLRMPMGLPGHRGLVWLSLLVAVVLTARTRAAVLAVGAAATWTTLGWHLVPGPWDGSRYLAAAVLLYAVSAAAGRRRWPVVVAAAPTHLVALAGPAAAAIGGRYWSASVTVGMTEKALFHLGFGLAAGLLGWAVACGADRALPRRR
ncbi:hypothetical protein H7I01_13090 [Mycobacterium palustre]|uniref:Uncharacterized protein n=1 Tax=Mycobacterium palustre TaxID=153971 RepID=A0A1X1ZPY7_9MYCO|nr:hypothetical protein [Mycobacterium palustre]ORW25397.1 hypothetical protein AWC19_07780 [Mycobacterium palustre]